MGRSTNGEPITPYLNSWAYTMEADRLGHHHFKCFSPKGSVNVRASSTRDAQVQAAKHWKIPTQRYHTVAVVLYAKFDEEPTVHSTSQFG
jgi:hypothetical protein